MSSKRVKEWMDAEIKRGQELLSNPQSFSENMMVDMDDEDREAMNEAIDPNIAAVLAFMLGGKFMAGLGFMMGLSWANYKNSDQSEMNDLLKDVKGL